VLNLITDVGTEDPKYYDEDSFIDVVIDNLGPAVSASFLFIIGLANSVILWRIVKRRSMVRCSYPYRLIQAT
jgi:high-affinity nickel permease